VVPKRISQTSLSNAHLIGPDGAESSAGVLRQYRALAHLILSCNEIGAAGAEERVLQECWHSVQGCLTSISGTIEAAGAGSFAGLLAQSLAHLTLNLRSDIGGSGDG
jgi:hypothetical protein